MSSEIEKIKVNDHTNYGNRGNIIMVRKGEYFFPEGENFSNEYERLQNRHILKKFAYTLPSPRYDYSPSQLSEDDLYNPNYPTFNLPLSKIHYISADRLGPQEFHLKTSLSNFPNVGVKYKNMRLLLIFVLTLYCNFLFSQETYFLIYDEDVSAITNAENLLLGYRILSDFQKKRIKNSFWKEDNWKEKTLGVGYRLTKSIALDLPLAFMVAIHQHEIFGHGYRFREFGYTKNSYFIGLPPPYGFEGGYARNGKNIKNRVFSWQESATMSLGGNEANRILARSLQDKWILRGAMNYREAMLFPFAFHNNTYYILGTRILNRNEGDVASYINKVNRHHGFIAESAYQLDLNDLSKNILVNFLNPFQYFAAYNYVKTYLLNGEDNFKFPMIAIRNIKYLPSFRFGLTPFGGEWMMDNDFLINNDFLQVNFRLGDGKLDDWFGGNVRYLKNITERCFLKVNLSVWHQPSMILGGETLYETPKGLGGRISLAGNYRFEKENGFGLYGQLGYKTAGYEEGENLAKGVIFRFGLSFSY